MCNLNNLSETEKEVLIKCAKLGMSINSNKKLESIIKRFPLRKRESAKDAIKKLVRKGCLRIYKSKKKIYCFTRNGMKIAYSLLSERQKEIYPDFKF